MSIAGSALALALAAAPVDPAPVPVTLAPAAPVVEAGAPVSSEPVSAGPVVTGPVAPAATPSAQPAVVIPPATPAPANPAAAPPAAGDIVVAGRTAIPGDPLATVNAKSFEVIQGVDRALVGPIAKGYERGLPEPVRDGLGNFITNLREPVVFLNFLLQLKPGKALRTVGRFAVNSTLGLGGVVDVAKRKPFNLPRKLNGFEDTFACYGIGSGPYLFLPLIGPTTLRDVIGVTMGRAFVPLVAGSPFNKPYYALPAATIDTLNVRVAMDADLQRIREETNDPYAASRDLYLKQRYRHLMELCPRQAAKAFKFPASLKAELKAEGTPLPAAPDAAGRAPASLTAPVVPASAPLAVPAPAPAGTALPDRPQEEASAPQATPAPPQ